MQLREKTLFYGGDYNPEQWEESVWQEDMRLMKMAKVNFVSMNIFSWANLQPSEEIYDFRTLDKIMDMLHENHIYADLATATASPPAWLSTKYPSSLPVGESGKVYTHGGRQHYCPNSSVYRKLASELVERLVKRYKDHPALIMWHINNEYGCHISECYCENCVKAFRTWLQNKYQEIFTLNQAWSTDFWSQKYYQWEEILLPAKTPNGFANPGQMLDYKRFMSDSLLDCYKMEKEIIKQHTPNIPVMTNLLGLHKAINGFKWAREMDIATWDSYPEPHVKNSYGDMMAHDLTRSLKKTPFLLMEQAVSHVNWRAYNPAKRPDQMRLHSYQALAHGADGIMFFQWRASQGGAEKFHSGMVSHCGSENSRTFKEVVALGEELQALKEIEGTNIYSKVGILFDWENWWALELDSKPTTAVAYLNQVGDYYRILREYNVSVDFVHPDEDMDAYQFIIAPSLYLVSEKLTQKIEKYVAEGGTFLTNFFSGYVNENDQVYLGGYPGALKNVLGIEIEEFDAMIPEWTRQFSYEEQLYNCNVWADSIKLENAKALGYFTEDYYAGLPAITQNNFGKGYSYYIGTQPERPFLQMFLQMILEDLNIHSPLMVPKDVEVTVRENDKHKYVFLLNYNKNEVTINLDKTYISCLSGEIVTGELKLGILGADVLKIEKY